MGNLTSTLKKNSLRSQKTRKGAITDWKTRDKHKAQPWTPGPGTES